MTPTQNGLRGKNLSIAPPLPRNIFLLDGPDITVDVRADHLGEFSALIFIFSNQTYQIAALDVKDRPASAQPDRRPRIPEWLRSKNTGGAQCAAGNVVKSLGRMTKDDYEAGSRMTAGTSRASG